MLRNEIQTMHGEVNDYLIMHCHPPERTYEENHVTVGDNQIDV